MHRLSAPRGFTLIELMIVVVIIGVLTALAVPRFMQATTKAKQSEAKSILKQIYVGQRAYRQQVDANGYFMPAGPMSDADAASRKAFNDIWVDLQHGARYTYTIVATPSTFTATATANLDDDPTVDTWTIDQNGVLTNTINDAIS